MNLSPAVSSDWTMEEVYLYRPGKAGYIVYNPDVDYWDATGKHAKKAHAPGISIPDDYTQDKYKYETADTEKSSLLNTIYALETPATGERLETTALVVGLLKKGESKTQYYRIDIKKDAYNNPIDEFKADILRNYTYNITINSVNNAGKDDEDTAYEGDTGYTLEATVDAWDESMKQNVVMDGKYSLTVSHDKLHFGSDGGSPVLEFTTNYDGDYDQKNGNDGGHRPGIFIDEPTGGLPDWLTITNEEGIDEDMNRKIKVVAEENTTGAAREETSFTVRAGNMRYIIKVNQDKDPWLTWSVPTLYVMDSDYKAIDLSANFAWTAEIGANPNNTLISVETPSGEATAQKDVIFRTMNRYGKFKDNPIDNEPPDYIEENTTVVFKDPLGINVDKTVEMMLVCPVDFGESNCYMIDAKNPRPLRIPLSQIQRAMGDKPEDAADPGYIGNDWVPDMDNLRAQVLWTSQRDRTAVQTIGLYGTDESIAKIVYLRNKGTLDKSDIIMVPGKNNIEGNCVVILYSKGDPKAVGLGYYYRGIEAVNKLRNERDVILWSWHIWSSNYYPYENDLTPNGIKNTTNTKNINPVWLDRNIGALSNVPGDYRSAGFFYQWGKKDPYETIGDSWTIERYTNVTTNYPIYTGALDEVRPYFTRGGGMTVTNSNMLWLHINHPMFAVSSIPNSADNGDWYSSALNRTHNDDLWGGGSAQNYISYTGKSVYDPCPAGYMVPRISDWGVGNQVWTPAEYGVINKDYGGYYPAVGYGAATRNYSWFADIGRVGYYNSATPSNTTLSKITTFDVATGSVSLSGVEYRASLTPIRCIAENP